MKNKISVITMVLYIVCAVIWDLNLIKCFMLDNVDNVSYVLDILCAVLWTLSATISVIQYVKDKNKINK